MTAHHLAKSPDVERVEKFAHTNVTNCYQCGKCSAGCPMGDQMDVLPSTIIRFVQNGDVKEAASANSIWKCLACLTCTTRCPKEVDIAAVMDALKQISIEKRCVHRDMREIVLFQRSFLNNIRRNGRTNELELVAEYKIRGFLGNFNPFWAIKDSMLGPAMLAKGKLHIGVGSPVKDKALVKRIFDRCLEGE